MYFVLLINGSKGAVTLIFCGLFAAAFGLLLLLGQPYEAILRWKCTFEEGGEIFEMWRKPPVDIYMRVFLFNITNKDAFLRGEEILRVEEVGPYVYRELMSHENITFNPNGTLSTSPSHPLVWVPEMSEGRSEDDVLVLPNVALLSITHLVSTRSYFTRLGLNMLIRQTNTQPVVTMTAREYMFGYESTLLNLGSSFLPFWIDFGKLGLIDRMYNFRGDYETINTGEEDPTRSGVIETYRGSTHIPQWDGYCADISGSSNGAKFHGEISPNDTLRFFRKNICRAMPMVMVNETVSSGLNGYRYHFEENVFDNGKFSTKNSCFCREGKCLPAGVLDVSDCYYGFPIAVSYPHLLDADPKLLQQVNGSKPDPEKHRSYFVIQPKTGLTLELAARFQINLALGDLRQMANVDRFSNITLPILWTDTRLFELPKPLATRFYLYLVVAPTAEVVSIYLSLIGGVLLVLYAIKKFTQKRKKQRRCNVPWIDEEMMHQADRKLSNYVPKDRASMTAKELEVYFDSLITPLNQHLEGEGEEEPCVYRDE